MPLRVVVFDVNETLFSLAPVAEAARSLGLDDAAFALWFPRVLRDGFAAAASGTWAGFADIARHHVLELLRSTGQDPADDAADPVIEAFQAVTAQPDVAPAFARLREEGVGIVTLTNGTAAVTEAFLERSGLTASVDAVHDVGSWQAWKPRPEPYRGLTEVLDVAPREAAMVAVHPWDVHGARQAGLRSGWVNRDGARYPGFFTPPHVQGATLTEVADELLGLSTRS